MIRFLTCVCGNRDNEEVQTSSQPLPPCSAGCGHIMQHNEHPSIDEVLDTFIGVEVALVCESISLPVRITRLERQPGKLIRLSGSFVTVGIPLRT